MRIRGGTTGIVLATVLVAASAWAADQLLGGSKLMIRNPPSGPGGNRVVHVAKDASITVGAALGAGDPTCMGTGGGGISTLRIVAAGGAGDVTIPLPCAGWSATGTRYRYTDTSGSTCRLVLVRQGALSKVVCKGTQVAIDLNGGMSPVSVVLTLNTEQYCTEFGGTALKDGSDDRVFLRKEASPPATCPLPTTTTTSTSSTTSTIIPPSCSSDPCGSCGDGTCYLHQDADPPTYVCASLSTCAHMACSDDSQCSPGFVCIMSVSTACCAPCF
jgi:hypothetical protein